jgi:hypothetical protein
MFQEFSTEMQLEFEMSMLGELLFFLALEFINITKACSFHRPSLSKEC